MWWAQNIPLKPAQWNFLTVWAHKALVIFDCDGVLIDSERLSNQVLLGMLSELGLQLSLHDMFEHFVGYSHVQCYAKITSLLGKALPPDFAQHYHVRTQAAFLADLQPIAGIEIVLNQLDRLFCVASNSSYARLQHTLQLTRLLPRFEGRIFSAMDVARPKPAPDIFLHAAHQLKVAPNQCVVVEDSPIGVRAGVAAGMTVLGFAQMMPAQRLHEAGAHFIFENMSDLPALLAQTYNR